ncbi:MAG: hypothetical protein Q4C70_03100 [Planctomycetia bacterium]|nr:hypothetical protein [Planctomycetia bacterium]
MFTSPCFPLKRFFVAFFIIGVYASVLNAEDFWLASAWKKENGPTVAPNRPLFWDSGSWQGSSFFQGGDWARIGKGTFHPGSNAPALLIFTSPVAGEAKITGRAKKIDFGGNGVNLQIRVDDETVWEENLGGEDKVGVEHHLTVSLKVGTRVGFRVDARQQIGSDATGWNPEISVGGKVFTLAEGIELADGKALNPANCWSFTHEDPWAQVPMSVTQAELDLLRETLRKAVLEGYETPIDAELWRLQLEEWKRDDAVNCMPKWIFLKDTKVAENAENDAEDNTEKVVERTPVEKADFLRKLGKHLKGMRGLYDKLQTLTERMTAEEIVAVGKIGVKLADMERRFAVMDPDLPNTAESIKVAIWEKDIIPLYFDARVWKRALVFANPLMKNTGPVLFVKRRPTAYNHMVMQYFGWRAQHGGGLCILAEPGKSLKCKDILAGKMEGGNITDPCVSWDGKKVLFSWVDVNENALRWPWNNVVMPNFENEIEEDHSEYYHIYEVNTDGSGLRQLTDSHYEDLMPCYLPDGGIAFISSRRKGHARCFWWAFGRRWTTFATFRMNADGKEIQQLSWHDTNEWYPTVGHDGQIYYARWDYIDRDAVTHQNLWSMRPDGTNPTAVWGNASLDIFCSFQAKPIPESRKWILTASAHHSCTGGSLVILDPSVAKDGPAAIERITPEVKFPEAEAMHIPQFYASPWPLSEDFYLVAYSPFQLTFEPYPCREDALGLYVYDRFGNRELLYRDRNIGCDSPMTLTARKTPPVLPSFLPENAPDEGRFFVQDIYQGLGDKVERGSIKELRVVQIFLKTNTDANDPAIGLAGEENGRAILGTVPVEADGSVNFIAPARTPILFQALNEKGEAFQIMRSLTYLQPGEEIACIGCHEDRNSVVDGKSPYFNPSAVGGNVGATGNATRPSLPIAAGREPSRIVVGKYEGRPFSYMESVQPILDAKCVSCHGADPENAVFKKNPINLTGNKNHAVHGGFSESYVTLMKRPGLVPRWEQRNRVEVTMPGGEHGAIGSGLKKVIADENHRDVKLTPEEWSTIATWIDQNAIFYGTTVREAQKEQFSGKPIPMQELQ